MEDTGEAAWGAETEEPPPVLPLWPRAHFPPPSPPPPPGWGNSHHPKAEGAPEGGSCLARNDCPSVNNLLLPRAPGSEGRRAHNGLWS